MYESKYSVLFSSLLSFSLLLSYSLIFFLLLRSNIQISGNERKIFALIDLMPTDLRKHEY